MEAFELQGGANIAIQGYRDVNRYLQEEAPWLKKGDEHKEFRQVVVRASLEAIYALTHLMMPFLPVGSAKIFEKLGKAPIALKDLSLDCRNMEVGSTIQVGEVLYEKVRLCIPQHRASRLRFFFVSSHLTAIYIVTTDCPVCLRGRVEG